MSRDQLDQLLQECLSAYETGLSPEECLSAFPEHRQVLEPLFRQALSLRVAYAAAPSEEFKQTARERFLFAAGREAGAAYSRQPDPTFVASTRQRLRNAAGASAQEALRAVPPPRLPFWINTRRRLLEAAAAPRPVLSPMAVFTRVSAYAAVLVLAFTLAGLAFLTTQSQPSSVGAELTAIEEQLTALELQALAGQSVEPSVLIELSKKTNDLVQRLNELPPSEVTVKLPDIIDRQKEVVDQAAAAASPPPELVQAKQQLNEADQGIKLLAARADQATATATSVASAATQAPTTATASASGTPAATPTPVAGQPVQIRISSADTAIGLIWIEIKTSDIRFVVPDSWQIGGVSSGPTGMVLTGNFLSFGIENATILIDMRDGDINALVGNESYVLRASGPNARPLTFDQVVQFTGTLAPQVFYFLSSVELASAATATPTTTATQPATPALTVTPAP